MIGPDRVDGFFAWYRACSGMEQHGASSKQISLIRFAWVFCSRCWKCSCPSCLASLAEILSIVLACEPQKMHKILRGLLQATYKRIDSGAATATELDAICTLLDGGDPKTYYCEYLYIIYVQLQYENKLQHPVQCTVYLCDFWRVRKGCPTPWRQRSGLTSFVLSFIPEVRARPSIQSQAEKSLVPRPTNMNGRNGHNIKIRYQYQCKPIWGSGLRIVWGMLSVRRAEIHVES